MTNQNPADERGNDLEITVCANGVVNVRNARSGSGDAHSVLLDGDGAAVRCSCKGHRFHGHCYHTGEVERRPLVVSSATAAGATYTPVATDGGEVSR